MGKKYVNIKEELEQVIEKLQAEGTSIDEAILLHKQATELLGNLENYLKKTRSDIRKLKMPNK